MAQSQAINSCFVAELSLDTTQYAADNNSQDNQCNDDIEFIFFNNKTEEGANYPYNRRTNQEQNPKLYNLGDIFVEYTNDDPMDGGIGFSLTDKVSVVGN